MRLKGVVKGQTIECDQPIGLVEGQRVEVEITPTEETEVPRPADEGELTRADTRELLAKYGIRPTPSRGYVVTNDMVNRVRDELGI